MKYKLQVEKLKQIQMEKDLIKELEEENAKLVSENEDLVTDLFNTQARERSRKIDIELLKDRIKGLNKEIEDLKAENEKMKVGLFQRMETINDLDYQIKELKAYNERLFNTLPTELARGFSLWLLSNYHTSEEGMSLCWIDCVTKTKHGNNEVFEIYLNGLK